MNRQAGFTLIELILAMTVFSFVLLIITAGFINIMHLYEAGLAQRTTQQNARSALGDIVDDAHGAYQVIVSGGPPAQQICLYEPGSMVQYYVNTAMGNTLYKFSQPANANPTCSTVAAGGQSITSSDTGVKQLLATPSAGQPQLLNLTLAVVPSVALSLAAFPGGNSVNPPQCPSGTGAQFCSVALLNSSVSLQGVSP